MERIELLRKEFLSCLSVGGMFSGRNKVIPILDNVKCKITVDGKCIVSSYDGQNSITKSSMSVSNGSTTLSSDLLFCVDFGNIVKCLRSINDDVVSLVIEDNVLSLHHRKGSIEMPISSVDDFPTIEYGDATYSFDMDSALLRSWCGISRNFVGSDQLRPIMESMYLYVGNGELGVCATDSRRLYTDSISFDTSGVDDELGVCVPSNVLSAVQSICDGSTSIRVNFYERNVSFVSGDARVVSLLMEGRYPKFKTIIPTNSAISVSCDRDDLLDSVSRLSLQANNTTKLIRLKVEGMSMNLLAEDVDYSRKGSETVVCSHSGSDITIGCNGDYLCNCLNAVSGNDVLIHLLEPSRPVIIKEKENERKILLFMPCMLN